MIKINCIAIDDESLALNKIKRYVEKIEYLNLIETFNSAIKALSFIKENPVQLIFLDIEMDEFTGIQFLQTIQYKPFIIFTTAYDSYALKGYEFEVADYLVKPISFQRFIVSVEKVYVRFKKENPDLFNKSGMELELEKLSSQKDFFFVKSGFNTVKILVADILYIEGMKDYLLIITKKEKTLTIMTFKQIIDKLPKSQFVRVHKSYIIAIDKIDFVTKNRIRIGDKSIPVGATYNESFDKALKKKKS